MACTQTEYDELHLICGTNCGGGSRKGVQVSTGFACIGDTITSLTFRVRKAAGSPTGTMKFAIWNSSDVEQVNFGTYDVSTLTEDADGEEVTLDTPSTSYDLANGDFVAISYTGGNESNYIASAIDNSLTITGQVLADYPSGSWRTQSSKQSWFKINDSSPPPPASSGTRLPPPPITLERF